MYIIDVPAIPIRKVISKPRKTDMIRSLMQSNLFVVSVAILLGGVAFFAVSESLTYVNHDTLYQGGKGYFAVNEPANVTFYAVKGYPTNVSFYSPTTPSAHFDLYRLTSYNNRTTGGLIIQVTKIASGEIYNNRTVTVGSTYYPQVYYIILVPNEQGSYPYNVSVQISFTQEHHGNPYLGMSGMFGSMAAVFALTIFVTRKYTIRR